MKKQPQPVNLILLIENNASTVSALFANITFFKTFLRIIKKKTHQVCSLLTAAEHRASLSYVNFSAGFLSLSTSAPWLTWTPPLSPRAFLSLMHPTSLCGSSFPLPACQSLCPASSSWFHHPPSNQPSARHTGGSQRMQLLLFLEKIIMFRKKKKLQSFRVTY